MPHSSDPRASAHIETQGESFTVGVEEEYQIIDPETRALVPRGQQVLAEARGALGQTVQPELKRAQIEIATDVCRSLADVREMVTRSRREVIGAAQSIGCTIAAAATHPFADWAEQPFTQKPRYREIEDTYQQLAREQLICGCHIHVGLTNRDAPIHVLNRMRRWLAPLLALSANSPFWRGHHTGYASYRTELWSRWPAAGPPHHFDSSQDYRNLVQTLIDTGSVEDASKIYWDIRLPEHIDTIEIRVPDVCLTVDEAVMIAGLTRALVRTSFERVLRHDPYPIVRPELLRAAHWRAARHGLGDTLIDVEAGRAVPAAELIETLLAHVRPALEDFGDWDEVAGLMRETLARGTGADRQRRAYERARNLDDVVDFLVDETARGL